MSARGASLVHPAPAAATPPWRHLALTLRAPAPFHEGFTPEVLLSALRGALRQLGHEEGGHVVHRFEPQGVSLLLFGPRFRLAVHTWPERGLAALDVLCAGELATLERAVCAGLGMTVVERHRDERKEGRGERE